MSTLLRTILFTGLTSVSIAASATLPALNIDRTQTTVSGSSSGGYMAVQLHVAYSSRFAKGAAVAAGGPYYCAEGGVLNAVIRCLGKTDIPVDSLVKTTRQWATSGEIDPLTNLSASRVYLFSAANDSIVKESTTTSLLAYYKEFIPAANIVHRRDVKAEHGWVTDDYGTACLSKEMPFITNCNFDLSGAVLQHLYGALKPRRSGALEGRLIEFDQTAFLKNNMQGNGMGEKAWVFVPKSCAEGDSCRIHVALHGCKQNATDIGQEYVKNTGYNRWADSNNIVVLYPQTGKGATNSCWDWWGYDDKDYAKKSAPQMKAIVAMIDKLGSGATAAAKR